MPRAVLRMHTRAPISALQVDFQRRLAELVPDAARKVAFCLAKDSSENQRQLKDCRLQLAACNQQLEEYKHLFRTAHEEKQKLASKVAVLERERKELKAARVNDKLAHKEALDERDRELRCAWEPMPLHAAAEQKRNQGVEEAGSSQPGGGIFLGEGEGGAPPSHNTPPPGSPRQTAE